MHIAEVRQSSTQGRPVRFHVAGYLFTYRKGSGASKVRIDMWREDPCTAERYWITVAACAPNAACARSAALALVAWVKSCDVGPRRDVKSQAVAESFAMLREHLARTVPGASGSVRGRREITRPGGCGGTPSVAA